MNRNVRLIDINIIIDGKRYKDLIMNSTEGESSISKTDGIDIGSCVSEYISFNVYDPQKSLSSNIVNKDIKVEYFVLNNNKYNKVYQNYYVIDTKRSNDIFTIEAQDFLYKTEKNLSLITKLTSGTVESFLNDILAYLGCTYTGLKHTDVLNIQLNLDTKKYSGRDILSAIASYNGGFCRMSEDHKKVEFINLLSSYNKTLSNNSIYDKTPMLIYDEVGEVLEFKGVQYDYELQLGEFPFVHIKNNVILEHMKNDDEHIKHLNKIFNELKQIKYSPSEGVMFFEPDVRGGDFVKFNSVNGNYITLLSSINYGLGGKTKFRSYAISLIDNLKPKIKEDIEVEPEEPEPPEPEVPEFELEITNINKYKPEDAFIIEGNYSPKDTDDIWVRLDTIDYLRFMGDNYDGMDYMMPGTKGYETFEGEYGEGTYTLKEINDYMDYYKRYITPKKSMELVDWLEKLDDKAQKENIINFDRYMRVEDGVLWVKAFVNQNKLYIPSSYKYTIKLKNNDFKEGFQVYDDMYYIGYGTVRLVDKNNLTWYGLPNILDTYISDKIIMEHKLFTYMPSDNISEHYKSKDIYVEGAYDDLDKDVVGKNIGGILINDNKFKGSSRLVENENEDDSNYMYIKFNSTNNFLDRINERPDLYTDYDKEYRILNIPTGANIYTNELWAKSPKNFQSYYNGESMTIPYWYYKQVDWEWNFWREGYLLDKYRAFDSVEYYPDIRVLMRPKAGTTREHVEDMFIYEEVFRDYETEYTDRKITHIILNDINDRGEQTEEFEFKPFTDKNRVIYDRKMNYSGVGGGFDYHSDFTRFTQFYFYKDGGKERVNMGTIFQEDIEHFDGEYISDRLDRAADEFGYVYAMNVVDREDNRYTIPVDQYKSGSMENGPWVMYIAETRMSRSVSNGLDRMFFNSSPMSKKEDKYYWILNVDEAGLILELDVLNNMNKELELYTIKENEIIKKYESLVSDFNEVIFLLDDDNYDKLLIVGDYSADLKEGVLYTKNRQNKHYTYSNNDDTINIDNLKGVNKIWREY